MAKGYFPFRRRSDPVCHTETNNNTSDMSMRRSALHLPITQMAVPIYTTQTREDVEVGGRVLLQNFIHEELEHEGLPSDVFENHPPDAYGDVPSPMFANVQSGASASSSLASTPQGYKNEQLMQIGTNLRELATQFAASHERILVRRHADQVDLGHINRESFFNMLEEIFRNGVSRHCIVALFFFCSDVLIRCLKEEAQKYGLKLFQWCMDFLVDRVCKWVYEHGGWGRVLSAWYDALFKITAIAAFGVIITCGIVFIRKNW